MFFKLNQVFHRKFVETRSAFGKLILYLFIELILQTKPKLYCILKEILRKYVGTLKTSKIFEYTEKIVYYSVLIFNWWSIVYWLNYIFYAVYNNFFYNIGWRISAADSYNKEKIVYLFYPPPKDCGKKNFLHHPMRSTISNIR